MPVNRLREERPGDATRSLRRLDRKLRDVVNRERAAQLTGQPAEECFLFGPASEEVPQVAAA